MAGSCVSAPIPVRVLARDSTEAGRELATLSYAASRASSGWRRAPTITRSPARGMPPSTPATRRNMAIDDSTATESPCLIANRDASRVSVLAARRGSSLPSERARGSFRRGVARCARAGGPLLVVLMQEARCPSSLEVGGWSEVQRACRIPARLSNARSRRRRRGRSVVLAGAPRSECACSRCGEPTRGVRRDAITKWPGSTPRCPR